MYRCSEVELSLDEMESGSSAYMKEDLYKRKFVATWQELCELVGVSDSIESAELSNSTHYSGTNYPEINRRVQRLIKLDEFPDHFDIVDLIERCDSKHTLGIPADEKSTLSRKIFKEVGKILKERRQHEFVSHFGSHLTDSFSIKDDPAHSDECLLGLLNESSVNGQTKMEQVVEEFVIRQETQEQDLGKSPDHNEEGSNEEDEDEEEEELELVDSPSNDPVDSPSNDPIDSPSNDPMDSPSNDPVDSPSNDPVDSPSNDPVDSPSNDPVDSPSNDPVDSPSNDPVDSPSNDSVDENGLDDSDGVDGELEDVPEESSPPRACSVDGEMADIEESEDRDGVDSLGVGTTEGVIDSASTGGGGKQESEVGAGYGTDEQGSPPSKKPRLQGDRAPTEVICIDSDEDDVICIE